MFNKKRKKKKNKETNKKTLEDYGYTNNVLLTENGLIFVNDEEFIKEK